jgi:hypothetical protein
LSEQSADSDLKIGDFCSITIDHDNGEYLDAPNPEALRRRQSLLQDSPEIKKIQLINEIYSKKNSYIERINNQFFSRCRAGYKKNALIQSHLNSVIGNINGGNFNEAKRFIAELKDKLTKEFGATNFLGRESEAYKLVLSIEKELNNAFPVLPDIHSPSARPASN